MTQRLPDPALVVLVGASGSGKSRWARDRYRAEEVVSSDALRGVVGSGPHDLDASADAFALLETIVAARLGLGPALMPTLIVLGFYLPPRVGFVRDASAGARFVDSADDLDLFALRALANQPLHALARISADPAGAWRAKDPYVVHQLAILELDRVGLHPRRALAPPGGGAGPAPVMAPRAD